MGGCCSSDKTKEAKEEADKSTKGTASELSSAHPTASQDRAAEGTAPGADGGHEAAQSADPSPVRSAGVGTAPTRTPNGREDLFTPSQDDLMGIHPGLDKYANLTASEMDSDDGKSWHSLESMSSADLHTLHSKATTQATTATAQSKGKTAASMGRVMLVDDEPTDVTDVQSSAFLSPMDDDARSAVSAFSNAPHGYDYYNNDIPPTSSLAQSGAAVPRGNASVRSAGVSTAREGGGGGFTVTDVRRNTKSAFQYPESSRSVGSRGHAPFGDNDDDDAASFFSCYSMATTAATGAGAASARGMALNGVPPPRPVSPRSVRAAQATSAVAATPRPVSSAREASTATTDAALTSEDVGSSQFHSLPPTEAPSTHGTASARTAKVKWASLDPASARGGSARPSASRAPRGTSKPSSARNPSSAPSAKASRKTPSTSAAPSSNTSSARGPTSRPAVLADELLNAPPADMDDADLYEDAVSEAMTFHTALSYGTAATGRSVPPPLPAASAHAPPATASPEQPHASAPPSSSSSSVAPPPDVPATRSARVASVAPSDMYPVESEFTYVTARSAGAELSVVAASTVLPDPPGSATSTPAPLATRSPRDVTSPSVPPYADEADDDHADDAVSEMTFMTARSAGGATTVTEANFPRSARKPSIVVLSGIEKPTATTTTTPPRPADPSPAVDAEESALPLPTRASIIKTRPERPSAIRRRQRAVDAVKAPPARIPATVSDDDEY